MEALEVVETASLALNRDDSDLKKAKIVFQFLWKDLQEQESDVAHELHPKVIQKIEERWQEHLSGLLWFLEDPVDFLKHSQEGPLILPFPMINSIARSAWDL